MIRFNKVNQIFREGAREVHVLKDLDLHLEPAEIVTILGRSGSGKSTILDLAMGLTEPTTGTIVRAPSISTGYVFQRPALLPWRNLWRNVALPLEIAGVSRLVRKAAALKALDQVGMGARATTFPYALSGGMAQRAAIARALVQDPDVMLMDEPFSALDPILRENMNINLLRLFQRTRKSILFVTHSIDEAVILSDRILVLENGAFLEALEVPLPRPRNFETFRTREFVNAVRKVRTSLPIQPNTPK